MSLLKHEPQLSNQNINVQSYHFNSIQFDLRKHVLDYVNM